MAAGQDGFLNLSREVAHNAIRILSQRRDTLHSYKYRQPPAELDAIKEYQKDVVRFEVEVEAESEVSDDSEKG